MLETSTEERGMKRLALLVAATLAALVLAGPAGAITIGQLDTTNKYPHVGALIAEWDLDEPGVKKILCSGTLIREDPGSGTSNVFMTASHCTAFLPSVGVDPNEVWVTFDPSFDEDNPGASVLIPGTYNTHPQFACCGFNDTHDVAVVELAQNRTGAARLPTLNQLNGMALRGERFTAVGYGTVREDKTGGPRSLFFDGKRRYATQSFSSLVKSWLRLSMNPSTGSGGTCFGDSGGPHFLRDTNLVLSITVTGDRFCRATDVTYRVDTASARAFLDDFVTMP
jgi:hypothetical protein